MNKEPSQRQLKFGEELRHALSEIFMRENFYDPDTCKPIDVTVAEAQISPDLRNATVYVMPFNGENSENTMKILAQLTPQIRTLLSKRLRARYLPTLHFRLDDSFDKASKVESLLQSPQVQKDIQNN